MTRFLMLATLCAAAGFAIATARAEDQKEADAQQSTESVSGEAEKLPPESAAALAQLRRYMENTRSLTARFSSVLLDDTGRQTAESEGTLAYQVPGKFRWKYENPDPSVLLADGVDLWHYDEELEQVNVSSLEDYRGANPSLLLGGDSDKITEGFNVVGSHKTEGDQWIVLETRDRNSDFVTVRIKFSDEQIKLMELIDRVDQTSRIQFTDVEVNPDLDSGLFTFTVPEGASLIGQPTPVTTDSAPDEAAEPANL